MAHQEVVNVGNSLYFTFDELQDAFSKLIVEYRKISVKNKELKKLNFELNHKKKKISKKLSSLTCENQKLNDELKKIKPFVEKFIYSSKKLHMLLNKQRAIFDKAGFGFKPQKKQKLLKNLFVKASTNPTSNVSCYCCEKIDHKSYTCDFKKLNKKNY